MGCNWELFELRVVVFTNGVRASGRGFAGQGATFEAIYLNLRTLGISDFRGSNNSCDFQSVFNELIKLKTLPFNFTQNGDVSNYFGKIESAQRNKEKFPAAKLYVHRHDQSGEHSKSAGVGVLLEDVQVDFTNINNGRYHIHLSGGSARPVNY